LSADRDSVTTRLAAVHRDLVACRRCPRMIGPVVHGPPVASRVLLIGQAPGPHEGEHRRPFAWTAGRTLFRWFEEAAGISEEDFRRRVYMAAVARCFPGKEKGKEKGKGKGGGDRKPDRDEIAACSGYLAREVAILEPALVIPVGTLAIEQVLGRPTPLADVVGTTAHATFHGRTVDVIALPHPSGLSSWPKVEPGKTLLRRALALVAAHPAFPKP
jgi:uracil-DNA glycosylase